MKAQQNFCGERLKKLRKRDNYTTRQLANYLKTTEESITSWENGISEPDIKSLYVLCTLYGVSMDEFFSGVDAAKLVAPVYRDEYSNAVWKNKFSRARRFPW